MYFKFILRQIKLFFMLIFSAIFVYPFIVYPKRRKIWLMRNQAIKPWYFWYADTYETGFNTDRNNYINSTYGLYELMKNENGHPDYERFGKLNRLQKFILSFRWGVLRNGVWNYIIRQAPPYWDNKNYVVKAHKGKSNPLTWRNKEILGKQWITWMVDGEKFFRYSFTKKLFWKIYINFMAGTSDNRYLLKLRIFNYEY